MKYLLFYLHHIFKNVLDLLPAHRFIIQLFQKKERSFLFVTAEQIQENCTYQKGEHNEQRTE